MYKPKPMPLEDANRCLESCRSGNYPMVSDSFALLALGEQRDALLLQKDEAEAKNRLLTAQLSGREADLEFAERLLRDVQGHLERIAHFTLDMEYYAPGTSPAQACQTEAHEALKKIGVSCCVDEGPTEKPKPAIEEVCPVCWGDGTPCADCGSTGKPPDALKRISPSLKCDQCGGDARLHGEEWYCPKCNGMCG